MQSFKDGRSWSAVGPVLGKPGAEAPGDQSAGWLDLGGALEDRQRRVPADDVEIGTKPVGDGDVRPVDLEGPSQTTTGQPVAQADRNARQLAHEERGDGENEHPSETKADRLGRVRHVKVPGIVPDPASRAVTIPDSVSNLYLIGDGDSEPFRTRCVLARAAARHGRPGLTIRTVIATPGKDFNDMIKADAA